MATRPVRRSCCGRSTHKPPAKDFCGSLRISVGVTLVERSGTWSININHNGQQKDLQTALDTNPCPDRTAGVQLGRVVLNALAKAVFAGKQDLLRSKTGRQMPLVLLKDFLFKTAGVCSACSGRGCTTCNNLGVA